MRDDQFHNVEKVTLNSLNAPGNHLDLQESLHDLLSANKYSGAPLDIAINVAISDSDIVSQIGNSPFIDIPPTLATLQVCHVDKININPDSSWGELFTILPDIIKEMIYIAHTLEPIFLPNSIDKKEFSPNFKYDYYNNQTESGIEQINHILNQEWYTTSAINFVADTTNAAINISKLIFNALSPDNFSDLYEDLYKEATVDTIYYSEPINNASIYYQVQQPIELTLATQAEI